MAREPTAAGSCAAPHLRRMHQSNTPTPRPILSPTELTILAAIEDLQHEQGWAPTYTQILQRIGWHIDAGLILTP